MLSVGRIVLVNALPDSYRSSGANVESASSAQFHSAKGFPADCVTCFAAFGPLLHSGSRHGGKTYTTSTSFPGQNTGIGHGVWSLDTSSEVRVERQHNTEKH